MLLAAIATTAVSFMTFYERSRQHEIAALQMVADKAALEHSDLFRTSSAAQVQAVEAIKFRIANWPSDLDLDTMFDARFPRHGDGTRRSRPLSFDGETDASGVYTFGMGAYIRDEARVSDEDKKALLAAYDVVSSYGEALLFKLESFYYYSPNYQLVMFAPGRDDKLDYYRNTAPPDFNFGTGRVLEIISPGSNPERTTKCTGLENIVYDRSRRRRVTGCHTPLDIDGRWVGGVGTSLSMDGWLGDVVQNPEGVQSTFVIDDQGVMIAHKDLLFGIEAPILPEDFSTQIGATKVLNAFRQTGSSSGVIFHSPWDAYVSYARIEGPDWFFVAVKPASEIRAHAFAAASDVAIAGALGALMTISAIGLVVYRFAALPLARLMNRTTSGLALAGNDEMESRHDEFGALARALRERDARYSELLGSVEQRVVERTQELEQAREEASRANEAKSEFLAKMSHEIRTPMNGVLGMANVLQSANLPQQERDIVATIVESGDLLINTLNEILDLSKLESGKLEMVEAPFSLKELLNSTRAMHEPRAAEKSVDLEFETAIGDVDWISGDPLRIRQVLNNLVSNALKFTEDGAVIVRARAEPESNGFASIRFDVEDTGIGISSERLETLFQPFVQADASHAAHYGGTGLGLVISKALVELMGGGISATSEPGDGSTFSFEIRCARAVAPQAPAPQADRGVQSGLKILVADDNPTNRQVMQLLLAEYTDNIRCAINGADAVAQHHETPADLILMDIQMPEMNGIEATRHIREREPVPSADGVPIVALTANVMTHQIAEYRAAGMTACLAKPIKPKELRAVLSELKPARSDAA